MFRYGPRVSLLRVFAAVAIAFLLINAIGGVVAAGIGALLVLPILLFKVFFMLMVLRFVLGFAAGGHRHRDRDGGWDSGDYGFGRRRPWSRRSKPEDEPTPEEVELREYVRKAREQLDDLFPQA